MGERSYTEAGEFVVPIDIYRRRDVVRSFRKFKDCVDDVSRATYGTWHNAFRHLMNHCERDSIMRVVIDPLRLEMAEEAFAWFNEAQPGHLFMTPDDDEQRLAMLYQIMLLIHHYKADLLDVARTIDSDTGSDDDRRIVDDEIIRQFSRKVSYRLDDIITDTEGDEQVESDALMVFHYHGTVNSIVAGPGSIIATEGSIVSRSTATSTSDTELGGALAEALKSHIDEIADDLRGAATDSISLLVRAIDDKTIPRSQVDTAARTAVASSEGMAKSLREISIGAAGNLVASAIQGALGG
jgi:hypothetical protein